MILSNIKRTNNNQRSTEIHTYKEFHSYKKYHLYFLKEKNITYKHKNLSRK